jgi:hypothetical protein
MEDVRKYSVSVKNVIPSSELDVRSLFIRKLDCGRGERSQYFHRFPGC